MSQFPVGNSSVQHVPVRVVNKSQFPLPEYKHAFDSGMDVQANIQEPVIIDVGSSPYSAKTSK